MNTKFKASPPGKPSAKRVAPNGIRYPVPTAEAGHGAADRTPNCGPWLMGLFEYQRDAWERSLLFLDTLRQRAKNMRAHERAGLPPLLDFKYETILDGRQFRRPTNYALLHITEVGGACAKDCVEPGKPPVIILDPRAGHGPGIGGFKRDSEVGMALREGHEVYFVVFFPEPAQGQTLADVLHALRRFVDEVARRHSGQAPVLYGNCQAGWAVTLLAADCEGLAGVAVLNGSPLSYWAGASGVNPMRVAGGLLGGAWLAHLLSDLGDGRFDGAWLVQNFENLKPEGVWSKYATLFSRVDTERDRFLEFERWWNGYYFLSGEEFVAIVENLFIGNRLEQGRVRICDGCYVDLRRIRHPLVIFASHGDNITPPHQALGWIPAVYGTTDALKRAEQRIVYLINPHVGHLGIFVSTSVARLEHRAILESLGEIESLPPGLYEMKIDNPTGNPDCHKPAYSIRFEERRVEGLDFAQDGPAFERACQVSEINASLYRSFVRPWISWFVNAESANTMERLHPMRAGRYLFDESVNPWMRAIACLAGEVQDGREPLGEDHPFLKMERTYMNEVFRNLEGLRKVRDDMMEQVFDLVFGSNDVPRSGLPPSGGVDFVDCDGGFRPRPSK